MKDFLTAQEVIVLKEAHYDSRFRKQADRIKAILFLHEGISYTDTARLLMLDETTIRRYLQDYQKTGVDGLLACGYLGSRGLLTTLQEVGLTLHLKQHTYQIIKEIVVYVEKYYRKSYSIEGMTHLLHRLGFVYKKTKRIPGKLNPEKQAVFIREYEQLKANKQSEDKIYFLDATHPQHNNTPFYGWIYKGDVTTIKGNTGRKRLNLNGALNLEDLQITVLEEKTINTDAMMALLLKLEQQQPEGLLYAIVDNARYNHSRKLQVFLKRHRRIRLIYLPSYSPNLNVIERLWWFFQKKHLYNHYYETFYEFRTACISFFQNIDYYQSELKTLLTDSFQVIKP